MASDKNKPAAISMADEPEDPIAPSAIQVWWVRKLLIAIVIICAILIAYFNRPGQTPEAKTGALPEIRLGCSGEFDQNWAVENNRGGVVLVIPPGDCQTALVLLPRGFVYHVRPLDWIKRQREYEDLTRGPEEWDAPGASHEKPNQWVRGMRFRNLPHARASGDVKVVIVPG